MSLPAYALPTVTPTLPGKLTLIEFIQSVLVGVSGLPGTLVRPEWQVAPPKQPDIFTNWLAFGIMSTKLDTYAWVDADAAGNVSSIRHQDLEVTCRFYGPAAYDNAGVLSNGFQIPQNRAVLKSGNMDFTNNGEIMHVPDLVNERWVDSYQMSIFLKREVQPFYPVLTINSASGVITANAGAELFTTNWVVTN